MFKDNPVIGQLMKQGEERFAKLASHLLANETFVQVVQEAVKGALGAKGTLDKNVKLLLAAMNLPSTADIRLLNERLDDIERLLTALEERLEAGQDGLDGAPPDARA